MDDSYRSAGNVHYECLDNSPPDREMPSRRQGWKLIATITYDHNNQTSVVQRVRGLDEDFWVRLPFE